MFGGAFLLQSAELRLHIFFVFEVVQIVAADPDRRLRPNLQSRRPPDRRRDRAAATTARRLIAGQARGPLGTVGTGKFYFRAAQPGGDTFEYRPAVAAAYCFRWHNSFNLDFFLCSSPHSALPAFSRSGGRSSRACRSWLRRRAFLPAAAAVSSAIDDHQNADD